eukprot:TRINITY_DN9957_c0_g1_i1.p1 TRINITY_DN9957_c0_g1~~TRINITY_DN9957_c0_g1_i1.p1  ORF type:complete len:405 (+),score=124.34 TRINITY_DN9957_c0_g1_i1:61-1275(+)
MLRRTAAIVGAVWTASAGIDLDSVDIVQRTTAPTTGWSDTTWDLTGVTVGDQSAGWLCGNSNQTSGTVTATGAYNSKAGFQLLRGPDGHGTLEWVKATEAGALSEADRDSLWWRKTFDDLFCADYVRKYKNPRTDAADYRGVCIRDNTVGWRWKGIVQADEEARAAWEYHGNVKGSTTTPLLPSEGGYQRSTAKWRNISESSWNVRWGSGGTTSTPADWCSAYMKQTLCHIAFPQYAGPKPTNAQDWYEGNTAPANTAEKLVRPVCEEWADTIMDNCNRAEPQHKDDSWGSQSAEVQWVWLQTSFTGLGLFSGRSLQDLTQTVDVGEGTASAVREAKEKNSFWIIVWNRGFQLAQAGTGVGKGSDEGVGGPASSKRFCANWEAGSSIAPALVSVLLAVAAALVA